VLLVVVVLGVGWYAATNADRTRAAEEARLIRVVQQLESEIARHECLMRNTRLELEKMDRTFDIDVEQAVNAARASGGDEHEAAELQAEVTRVRVALNLELIERTEEVLSERRDELAVVRGRLDELRAVSAELPN